MNLTLINTLVLSALNIYAKIGRISGKIKLNISLLMLSVFNIEYYIIRISNNIAYSYFWFQNEIFPLSWAVKCRKTLKSAKTLKLKLICIRSWGRFQDLIHCSTNRLYDMMTHLINRNYISGREMSFSLYI